MLIDHLARVRKISGCVVKTVSGSDLMHLVAADLGLEVLELPVGFKHIAAEMLSRKVLIGGEESGGIGFGEHLPERDSLFAALLLLEAISDSGKPLGEYVQSLKDRFGDTYYDRLDIKLDGNNSKEHMETYLLENQLFEVAGKKVKKKTTIDGVKLRLAERHWLMFRFSGTEPLLRIYCEAPTKEEVAITLNWAKEFSESL